MVRFMVDIAMIHGDCYWPNYPQLPKGMAAMIHNMSMMIHVELGGSVVMGGTPIAGWFIMEKTQLKTMLRWMMKIWAIRQNFPETPP